MIGTRFCTAVRLFKHLVKGWERMILDGFLIGFRLHIFSVLQRSSTLAHGMNQTKFVNWCDTSTWGWKCSMAHSQTSWPRFWSQLQYSTLWIQVFYRQYESNFLLCIFRDDWRCVRVLFVYLTWFFLKNIMFLSINYCIRLSSSSCRTWQLESNYCLLRKQQWLFFFYVSHWVKWCGTASTCQESVC